MGLFKKGERWKRKLLPSSEDSTHTSTTNGASTRAHERQSSSTILTPPTVESLSLSEGASVVSPELDCLLIGIDFGTTYSGVAWAYSKQPEDIKIVTDWDCIEFQNADKGKAPTRITYSQPRLDSPVNGPKDGHLAQIAWGYGIENDDAAEWFKLLLLDEGDLAEGKKDSPQLKKAKAVLQRAGKTPVEVVGDYLRLLWNHAISNIEKDFGANVVKELRFQVVCTVPAVWTTQAVDRMRQAAADAGILIDRPAGRTTLQFVSEPEAAALATLEDLKARPNFKKGDTFVVCDAGGGTVDLISYKVIETNPMILAECVEGSGKLCGAVFLDQDFEALMEQLLGDAWDVPESAIKELMNSQWENGIKRSFEGQNKNWQIRLPYECVERGAPHMITLNQGHIREIFDNVVSQIQELVNDQISAIEKTESRLPKAVVLVGGFGSCRYLYKTLKMENEHRGIDVYQSHGMKPYVLSASGSKKFWLTRLDGRPISRGAVLKALTNSLMPGPCVQSRILRCSYGTAYHAVFDPKIHREEDKVWYQITGEYCAEFQMRWYLRKGDKIRDAQPYANPMEDHVRMKGNQNTHEICVVLYTCNLAVPPGRRDATVKRSSVVRTAQPLDTSDIPGFISTNGGRYKRVPFTIVMSVIGVAVEVAIVYKGERIGFSQIQADIEDVVSVSPFSNKDKLGLERDANPSTESETVASSVPESYYERSSSVSEQSGPGMFRYA